MSAVTNMQRIRSACCDVKSNGDIDLDMTYEHENSDDACYFTCVIINSATWYAHDLQYLC